MCTTKDLHILLPIYLGEVCFYFDFSQLFWEMSGKSWEKSYEFGRSPFFFNDRKCTKFYFDILLPTLLGEACFCFDFSQHFWEMSGKSWEKSYKFGRCPFFSNDRKCTKFYFDILLPTLLGEACFCFDFSQHFWEMSGKSWEKYVSSLHASPKLFGHLPTFLTSSNFNLKVRGHLRSFFLPRDNFSPCHIHLPTFLWFLVCF